MPEYTRSRLLDFGLSNPSELSESFTAIPQVTWALVGTIKAEAVPAKRIVYGNFTAGEKAFTEMGLKMLDALTSKIHDLGGTSEDYFQIAAEWNALVDKVDGRLEGWDKDAENVKVV